MALYTLRSGVNNHPEDSVLQHLTDITKKGGVINPSSDFVVSEHGAGGLFVDIAAGHAIVKGTLAYPIRNTAVIAQAITANSSGSPRITSVIVYVDTSVTPGATNGGNDVAKIGAINGTPGSSPVAPSDADIQTAIGANNPFVRLADVTVASGATGLANATIANAGIRVYLKSPSPRKVITYAATITPDFSLSNQFTCTITDNVTVGTPTNMEIGDSVLLELVQPAAGGKTVTWFANITWLSPDYSINSDSNKKSVFVFEKTSATTFNGYLAGKEY